MYYLGQQSATTSVFQSDTASDQQSAMTSGLQSGINGGLQAAALHNQPINQRSSAIQAETSGRKSSPENYYKLFKKNFDPRVNSTLSEIDKTDKYTKNDNISSLKEIIAENAGLGRKQMFNYCVIGGRMNCLKKDYKVKNKELDDILKTYDEKLYGKCMRNFYVSLYNFAMEFNKIIYVDLSAMGGIGNVYNKWSGLKKFIERDADFWKGV